MTDAVTVAVLVLGVGAVLWLLVDRWLHAIAVRRLAAGIAVDATFLRGRELVGRHPLAAAMAGGMLGLLLGLAIAEQAPYRMALLAIGVALGLLIEDMLVEKRLLRLEAQLADVIDLLVGSLQAGAGLSGALAYAAEATHRPLRPLLDDMSRRLRLGDDPETVFREPAARAPLASFRLFALSLGTQWEAGGSLAPTLALVGRSVRDRISLGRRVNSQTASAVGSMLAILAISYGLGLLMWLWEPERVEAFVGARVGAWAVAVAMVLQALGLLWMWRLAKIRL